MLEALNLYTMRRKMIYAVLSLVLVLAERTMLLASCGTKQESRLSF